MKLLCIIALVLGCSSSARCQTLKELLKQKQTQTEYLLQQIAALHVYIGYGKEGYQILDKGLTAIGAIKDGHLRLDQTFFSTMDIVSPAVRNYDKVAAIVSLEVQIVAQYKAAIKQVSDSKRFTVKEMQYVQGVYTSLVDASATLLGDLIEVTSNNVLKLSDDERIQRIDKIYADIQDGYSFALHFRNQCAVIAVQRAKEQQGMLITRKLYGLQD